MTLLAKKKVPEPPAPPANKFLNKKPKSDQEETGATVPLYGFVGGFGSGGALFVLYTSYILKTTGCNLQSSAAPGAYEQLIGEQGLSLAAVFAIFAWSLKTKTSTGKGLPAGPAGLLGAAEGLSFLAAPAALVVAALNFAQYGALTAGAAVCAATGDKTYLLDWI